MARKRYAPPLALAAFDLDGTLLNTRRELTPNVAEALRRAQAAGVLIVPATGRFYRAIPEIGRAHV